MATQQAATPSKGGDQFIGTFRRLESVGKGSFATVYKGVHPDDNTLVAIKTIQHSSLKGKLKDNLYSEIGIVRELKHPHIVALINVLESANHLHLVMEFCQLGDIALFVKKRDKLANHPVTAEMMRKYPNPAGFGFNEVVVRHFAKQLSSALEFLRSRNLVHRDLKPQNLLLNPPPSWIATEKPENRPYRVVKDSLIPLAGVESFPVLKIADFGFARYLPQTTMAETLCGSPLYMAPEILRYEKYDAKADLWSVGAVLFELMVGKPPFRAANHVELLRRIEKSMDKIKFPDELNISAEMATVIRGLLKKTPTERLSWDGFFHSSIIVDEIPNLVEDDRHPKSVPSLDDPPPASSQQGSPIKSLAAQASELGGDLSSPEQDPRPSVGRTSTGNPTNGTPLARKLSAAQQQRRPHLPSHVTEPAGQGIRPDRIGAVAMEKARSQDTHLKDKSLPKTGSPSKPDSESNANAAQAREKALRDLREKTAQDIAFERDYVMVEKRAVEVNAFADELAASPRIHGGTRGSPTSQAGTLARRAGQTLPSSAPGGQTTTTRQMQLVRPEAAHQRKHSYERKYDPGRVSATSALAAALNMVSFRLHGGPFAPASNRGVSPPQGYGPFPAFPATPAGPLLLGDSSKPLGMEEDHKILHTIEESASRSDVVFGFAEVKYKQLIPIAPSSDNKLGIQRGDPTDNPDMAQDDLTFDAIVAISEEALVLYVKTLGILTNIIALAGNWWAQKNRGEVLGEAGQATSPRSLDSGKAGFAAIGTRINHVVQWSRNRFNECLEKSEYVSRRLSDAQKKLPITHPAHPSNHGAESGGSETKSTSSDIHISTGVTAEKLMYDRAVDMSKAAAVNELVGEDLHGCEVSYSTAMRLLEAVLETDDDPGSRRNSSTRKTKPTRNKDDKDAGDSIEGIEESDRKTVLKLIESMRLRLTTLKKKIELQKASRKAATKAGGTAPSEAASARSGSTPMTRTASR